MSVFFSRLSFFFKLRERERGCIKLGIRRNGLKVYLSFFFDGVLWRIFLLLRANRLYLIFNTGLKKMAPSYPRYFFVFFYPEYLALVLPATNPVQQLTYYPFPLTGTSPHFRFRVPANRLASLFFPLGQAIP